MVETMGMEYSLDSIEFPFSAWEFTVSHLAKHTDLERALDISGHKFERCQERVVQA